MTRYLMYFCCFSKKKNNNKVNHNNTNRHQGPRTPSRGAGGLVKSPGKDNNCEISKTISQKANDLRIVLGLPEKVNMVIYSI
jgi:hypothetical protein